MMAATDTILSFLLRRANAISQIPANAASTPGDASSNVLLETFPALSGRVPWRPIGQFPTPVEEIPAPEGAARLFVKRDDLSCPAYGGNKVRKLEFLLAEAELTGRRTLITLGGVGSNHALATAVHGRALGFDVDLVLYDQPPGPFVARNLGGFLAAGARLHHAGGISRALLAARRLFAQRLKEGAAPYFIMVGGTCRLGCLGYVNAALELARQVAAGELPQPDVVFVPLGTTGTAAGLAAGFRLAGLTSRVAAVRVADPIAANATVCSFFADDLIRFLRSADSTISVVPVIPDQIEVLTDHFGRGYGHPTPAADEAIRQYAPLLALETTYTGKTLAACLDYCRRAERPTNVLFWNTINSAPIARPRSWAALPESLKPFAGQFP
jgi:D-cysteine desulfhydrase